MDLRSRTFSMLALAVGIGLALVSVAIGGESKSLSIAAVLLVLAGILTADLRGPRDPDDPRPWDFMDDWDG